VLPFAYSNVIPVRPRHLAPLGLVLFSGALLMAAAISPAWRGISVSALAIYAVATLAASMQVAVRKKSGRYLLLMPITFISLHYSYGLGSLWGAIKWAGIRIRPRRPAKAGRPAVAVEAGTAEGAEAGRAAGSWAR
jgi:hypothetical protein